MHVKLHDLSTEEMLTKLREGKLDLSIMANVHGLNLSGLRSQDISRQPLCLAVAPKHPLSQKKSVTLAEAARFPWLSFSVTEYPDYAELLKDCFSKAKVVPPIAGEHDSVASLIAAVESGEGVAIVTKSIACVAGARLKLIGISPAPKALVVSAVWPETGLSAAGQRFLFCTKDVARDA